MGTTISTTVINGITLASASQNPVTITPSGYVGDTGAANNSAIYGTGTLTFNVYNYGNIRSTQTAGGGNLANGQSGIVLDGGGSLVNGATGSIEATRFGVKVGNYAIHTTGTLDNLGTIEGNAATPTSAGYYGGYGAVVIGTVANGAAGLGAALIEGNGNGLDLGQASRVDNYGTIAAGPNLRRPGDYGRYGDAIVAGYLSVIDNHAGGLVDGRYYGIEFGIGGPGTVINSGTIDATTPHSAARGAGINLFAGGYVANSASGEISAALFGIATHSDGTVVNAGSITAAGTGGIGILLTPEGRVTNSGTITGGRYGIDVSGYSFSTSTIVNSGLIAATVAGDGIELSGGGSNTVVNAGTIGGAGSYLFRNLAVALLDGSSERVVVDPGAVFQGTVYASVAAGGTATLEFAAGNGSIGTAGGIGGTISSQYDGFKQIIVDAGAQWKLTGSNTIGSSVTFADAGDLTVTAGAALSGTLTVTAGGTLGFAGTAGTAAAVAFDGTGGLLEIDSLASAPGGVQTQNFNAPIAGFAAGDLIGLGASGLGNFAAIDGAAPGAFNTGQDTTPLVLTSGGTMVATLTLDGNYAGDAFQASDGSGQTLITLGGIAPYAADDPMMTNTNGAFAFDQIVDAQLVFTVIGGLGPEWEFDGAGANLLGDGNAGFLIRNMGSTSVQGAVAVGEVAGGQAQYTVIGGLGPEWVFEGNADFTGGGQSQFLIYNTGSVEPGVLDLAQVSAGALSFTPLGGLGPEWEFDGTGDFLGDGHQGFLLHNTGSVEPGALDVGEILNGQVQYTPIGGVGTEWDFEGVGDFLGDGRTGFLLYDTGGGSALAGTIAVGEYVGGQLQFSDIGAVGPEWEFVSTGNYVDTNKTDFLLRNTGNGAVVVASVTAGAAQFTLVGGVGSEWNFHDAHTATRV